MQFDAIGFAVYGETASGFQVQAIPWRSGLSGAPKLGVEDYVVTCAQRVSGEFRRGALRKADRMASEEELAAMREQVRNHLAAIDRGEVNA